MRRTTSLTLLALLFSVLTTYNTLTVEGKDSKKDLARKEGSIITLGSYEQDNDLDNGKEDIEWIVWKYDESSEQSMLISLKLLDRRAFNNTDSFVVWKNCSLRTWLNNDFYNEAFSSAEKKILVNKKYSVIGKNDTMYYVTDHVTIPEVTDFPNVSKKTPTSGYYSAYDTKYSSQSTSKYFIKHTEQFWLRTAPSTNKQKTPVARVRSPIYTSTVTNDVFITHDLTYIRPVIWINVDAIE